MKKSSLGAMIMLVAMIMGGCATGKNLAELEKEGLMLTNAGSKTYVATMAADCPSKDSGINCLVEKEGTEEGMLAYAKENNTLLVVEQRKESSSTAKNAAWNFMRIGAAASGSAGQGFAIGAGGGSFTGERYIEFNVVANNNLFKVDCGDFTESECRTNLQRLMMGKKIALKGNGSSVADQDMAEYMKRHSK